MKDNTQLKAQALSILNNRFGYSKFRPAQYEIIEHLCFKNPALVVMPTGGGKSLCFQIPALLHEGTTVVVSPLISLMMDQVDALKANGVNAAFINSSQSKAQQKIIEDGVVNGEIKLVYVAPETFVNPVFLSLLNTTKIAFIAVDEAHCISAWGHDFRPEYTQLKKALQKIPACPIIALTATADELTRKDILNQLGIEQAKEFVTGFDRPNLSLNVLPGKERWKSILQLLLARKNTSGIIYCNSRKTCENIALKLQNSGFDALPYHAGLHKDIREQTQDAFIKDDLSIVVATIAFGMGIDKANVRWVIHYNLPKNIESYYQEIGRAGRDGAAADTFLFSTYADVVTIREFIAQGGQKKFQESKLQRLIDYTEARVCRRKVLLNYFGDYIQEDCGNCDVCAHPPKLIKGTILAQKALSAAKRTLEKEGMNVLIEVLKGSNRSEIYAKSYHLLPTFGVGKDLSYEDWREYFKQLLNLGYFAIQYAHNNALKVTELGDKVLFEKLEVDLVDIQDHQKKVVATKKQAIHSIFNLSYDKSLFESMRKLRLQIAKKEKKAPYMIFSDLTLQQLAAVKPQHLQDFILIEGIGNHKKDQYGADFLQLILQYSN